mgnify:CR=1 FL=1
MTERDVVYISCACGCGGQIPWRPRKFINGHNTRTRPRLSVLDRFWRKVQKTEGDGCWWWTGTRTLTGYGTFNPRQGVRRFAHRVAYEAEYGSISPGLLVLHLCDNRICVRPSHLRVGTAQENSTQMVERGRQAYGERVSNAKLTDGAVSIIRARYAAGESLRVLSQEFGVGPSHVWQVATGSPMETHFRSTARR